ncbi:MAG: hypothetical protein PWQ84_1603 [Thermotogaceae bacterium]|nr:hypothetical protein [Thermotogaceae bacterium]
MKKKMLLLCALFFASFIFSYSVYTEALQENSQIIKQPSYELFFKPTDLVKTLKVAKMSVYKPDAITGIKKPEHLLAIVHIEVIDNKYFEIQNMDFHITFDSFVTAGTLKEEYSQYKRKDGKYNAYNVSSFSGSKTSLDWIWTRTNAFSYICSELIDTSKPYAVGFIIKLNGYNVRSETVVVNFQ